jgi:hypothetical protein
LERNHRRNRTAVWLRQFAKPPLPLNRGGR